MDNGTLPPLYYYVARLIRMYPFTRFILSYLNGWSDELQRRYNDPFLIEIANEVMADEKGHEKLILSDLRELKIPVQMALKQFPSDSVVRCIAAFKQSVETDPLHFLAWLFYSESQAVNSVTKQVLQEYQKMLGPFRKACRFWQVHSSEGPEANHVVKRKAWIQALPFPKQDIVMKELDRLACILANQNFDLNAEEFKHFINEHAPHLFEVAYRDTIKNMNQLCFESQL